MQQTEFSDAVLIQFGCNTCNHISFTSSHGVHIGSIVYLVFAGGKDRGANQSPPSAMTTSAVLLFPLNVSIIVQMKKIILSHKMSMLFGSDNTVPFSFYTSFPLPEGLASISLFFSAASGCTKQQQHFAGLSLSIMSVLTI